MNILGLAYDTQSATEYLTDIDPTTGAVTRVGNGLPGVAFVTLGGEVATGGKLYFEGMNSSFQEFLYVVDETTGALIASLPSSAANFTIDPTTGAFVGLAYDAQSATEYLTDIDPTTGAVTRVGNGLPGVAFVTLGGEVATGGKLYFEGMNSSFQEFLYVVDETTGALIASLPSSATNFTVDLTAETTCYLRGTRVATISGEVAVEDLRPGDLLITRFGPLRPIKWIGRQSFNGHFLKQQGAPICFGKGSIAVGVPCRDLYVSPGHSMVIADRLVSAELLINGVTITQEATGRQVDYFHIDLGVHDCVVANGAWSETYAERGNRGKFHNLDEFRAIWPCHDYCYQPLCLPQVLGGNAELAAIQAKLGQRLPEACFTSACGLHVLADSKRVDAAPVSESEWRFNVPSGTNTLRLVSNAAIPAVIGISVDRRKLGFCVKSLTARSRGETYKISPKSAALRDGFHDAEGVGGRCWRWTTGDAVLPLLLLGDSRYDIVLSISGHGLERYVRQEATEMRGSALNDIRAAQRWDLAAASA